MTQPEVSHANQMKYAINLLCRWEGKRAFGAEELRTGADVEPGAMDALEDAGVVQMGVPGGLPDGITDQDSRRLSRVAAHRAGPSEARGGRDRCRPGDDLGRVNPELFQKLQSSFDPLL